MLHRLKFNGRFPVASVLFTCSIRFIVLIERSIGAATVNLHSKPWRKRFGVG
jgi:hypothetical protein